MTSRLCARLSRRHPLVYDALGRPAMLAGGGLNGDLALLRFVLVGRDRFLADRGVARLCGAMRSLLCVYFLVFLSVPGLMWW
jgi:hypothetical protein